PGTSAGAFFFPPLPLPRPPSLILRRVRHARLGEALLSQLARVAPPARSPLRIRVVATECEPVINPQSRSFANDLGLCHLQKRRVNAELPRSLDSGLRGELRKVLERGQELRPAIGVAAVIEDIGPDEDVEGTEG